MHRFDSLEGSGCDAAMGGVLNANDTGKSKPAENERKGEKQWLKTD